MPQSARTYAGRNSSVKPKNIKSEKKVKDAYSLVVNKTLTKARNRLKESEAAAVRNKTSGVTSSKGEM